MANFVPFGAVTIPHQDLDQAQWQGDVAGLSNGRFVAVWRDDRGVNDPLPDNPTPEQIQASIDNTTQIYARLHAASGVPIGDEFVVNSNQTATQELPKVAARADGGYSVIWQASAPGATAPDQSGFSVRMASFNTNGTLVGVEQQVNVTEAGDQNTPALAALTDGRMIAAWSSFDGTKTVLHGRLIGTDGTPAGGEIAISTSAAYDHSGVKLAGLADGGFAAAWRADPLSDPLLEAGLFLRLFGADGSARTGEVPIASDQIETEVVVAQLTGGDIVAVWTSGSGFPPTFILRGRVFDKDGAPKGEPFPVADWTSPFGEGGLGGDQNDPAIQPLADGGFAVAWTTSGFADDSPVSVVMQAFDATGAPSGDIVRVNVPTAGSQVDAALSLLADGRIVTSITDLSASVDPASPDFQNFDNVNLRLFDPRGDGATVTGKAGADDLVGTSGVDVISSLGGADTLDGGGGDDRINAGAGDDFVNGGAGNDSIVGAAGFDTLIGGDGNDTLDGGANPATQGDIMLGGLGDDVYHVDSGLDLVDEGIVFGGAAGGVDTIFSHTDFFWDFYSAGDVLAIAADAVDDGGDGTTIVGSVFANFMVGNAGTNVLFGRGGADTYIAGDGIDFISLDPLGLTDENAYEGVDAPNTVIVQQRQTGPVSYDIVFAFEPGKDKLDVSDYGFTSQAAAYATGVNDGTGNCYFVLGDGLDYLYIVGLEKDALSAGDFVV